jgi:hypothetical protein
MYLFTRTDLNFLWSTTCRQNKLRTIQFINNGVRGYMQLILGILIITSLQCFTFKPFNGK